MNVEKWPLWLGYRDSQLVRRAFTCYIEALRLSDVASKLKVRFTELIGNNPNIAGQFNSETWTLALARAALAPMLSVMGHEMIHVAQRPFLTDTPFGRRYRGKLYGNEELYRMMTGKGYIALPWETEAYAFQMALYGMFLDRLSLEDRRYVEATEDQAFTQLLIGCSEAAALWKSKQQEGAGQWRKSF